MTKLKVSVTDPKNNKKRVAVFDTKSKTVKTSDGQCLDEDAIEKVFPPDPPKK